MKMRLEPETIALRAAREFFDGAVVNLGFGIPSLAAGYLPEGRTVFLQSESGVLGFGRILDADEQESWDPCLVDAGGHYVAPMAGMSFFDHAAAFGMIRGGHIDITVMGAYQVSEKGDLANWSPEPEPDYMLVGGAMDLAVGAKKVIICMLHTTNEGAPRIVRKCTLPLTGKECVELIITDLAVIEVTKRGLILREICPGWTAAEVQALTEARLTIDDNLRDMEL